MELLTIPPGGVSATVDGCARGAAETRFVSMPGHPPRGYRDHHQNVAVAITQTWVASVPRPSALYLPALNSSS